MSEIVSFNDYLPPARFDDIPWTQARIAEASSHDGVYTTIDTITFGSVDPDPADPQERSFTTANGTGPDLWYTVTFVDGDANVSLPTVPVQNNGLTPYATVEDLFRVLKIRTPSSEQTVAAQGDIDTATIEIDAEIDLADDSPPLTSEQLDLCKGVCIDRAADLWRHRESAPGILGVVDEGIPTQPGRYSFERYVARLSVLKDQWGVA